MSELEKASEAVPGSQAPVLCLLSSVQVSVPGCAWLSVLGLGHSIGEVGSPTCWCSREPCLPRPGVCNLDSGLAGRSVWPLRRTPRCTSAAVKAISATSASPTCQSLGAQKVRSPWKEGSKWDTLEPGGWWLQAHWRVGVGGLCDTGLHVSPSHVRATPDSPHPAHGAGLLAAAHWGPLPYRPAGLLDVSPPQASLRPRGHP